MRPGPRWPAVAPRLRPRLPFALFVDAQVTADGLPSP
jgi:hypothetical protein